MNYQRKRTGWNTRGGTWRDDLEYAQDQSQKNNPESRYWYKMMQDAIIELRLLLGEAYGEWAEEVWPGDIEQYTAKKMYEDASAKLSEVKAQDLSERYNRHWSDDPRHYSDMDGVL